GATETALTAATLAKGTTRISNAAREPEVADLCRCLIAMGAQTTGVGTGELVVEGVAVLKGATHRVMPDRIEAGTYAIAAVMAGGEVELGGASREHIASLLSLLEKAGALVSDTPRGLNVTMNGARPRAQ